MSKKNDFPEQKTVLIAWHLDTEPKIARANPHAKIVMKGITHKYATEFKQVSQG